MNTKLEARRSPSRHALLLRLLMLLAVMLFVAVGCKPEEKKEDGGEKKPAAEGSQTEAEGAGETAAGEKAADETAQPTDPTAQPADPTAQPTDPTAQPADPTAQPTDPTADAAPTDTAAAPDAAPALVALPTESAGGVNPYLEQIPADTLYAWASVSTMTMAQMPFDVADFVPMYEAAAKQMMQDPANKALGEILMELAQVVRTDGIEGLGLKDGGHYALYGVGIWPVLRFQLSDGKKFEAFVGRVLEKTGVQTETGTFQNTSYRALVFPDVTVVAAILENEAIVTLVRPDVKDWVLGYAFGATKPAATLASTNKVPTLAGRAPSGAAGVSAGFLDVLAVQKTLAGEAQNLAAESLAAIAAPMPLLEGVCKDEFAMLAAAAPQLVYTGYYGTDGNMVANLTLDIADDAFRSEFSKVKGTAPGLGGAAPTGAFGYVGLGIKLKDAIAFLTSQAGRIQGKPFQCQELTFFNELAQDIQGIEQRVPPFLMEVTGAFVQVDSLKLDPQSGQPRDINALVTIGTSQPKELWMAAGAISPELAKVELTKEPQKLPAIPGAEFLGDLFAASSDNALGIALGQSMVPKVTTLLAGNGGAPTPLIVIGYDQAKLAQLLPPEVMQQEGMAEIFQSFGGFGMTSYGISIVDQGLQIHIVQHLAPKKAATP